MTPINKPPIFCDECASLALATMEDAPLCAQCLQALLETGGFSIAQKIEPLKFQGQYTSHSSMYSNFLSLGSSCREP